MILLTASCRTPGPDVQPGAAPSAPPAGGSRAAAAVYLQPGDIVRLAIWREADLSGDFTVDEEGIVVFPKLGPMRVVPLSADSLRTMLVASYSPYLRNPSITVTPLRRVGVDGAVQRPGLYPVDPTTSVADALALAGGVSQQGNTNRIELIRGEGRERIPLSQQRGVLDYPIRTGDRIFVPERSWISRNSGVVATALTGSLSVIIALLAR